jgi:pyruvate formate lyase activating enzyme
MDGIIFDIQYYSLYDGPGIRTCIFLKGCPLHCRWCHNPESQSPYYEIAYAAHKCRQCGKCVLSCKNKALSLTRHGIKRDPEVCAACGECADICPNNAIERIGKTVSSDEIAAIVARDIAFYRESGGGVTITGGEPTAQIDFLLDTLKKIKACTIHTAIETCGYFPEKILPDLTKVTDLFLFDIKHINKEKHLQYTGVYPDIILENFEYLVSRCKSGTIIPRIPLIPGFNTDPTSTAEIVSFLQQTGYSGVVHLMPYNKLARSKYEKLNIIEHYTDMGELNEDDITMIASIFEKKHFNVICH